MSHHSQGVKLTAQSFFFFLLTHIHRKFTKCSELQFDIVSLVKTEFFFA